VRAAPQGAARTPSPVRHRKSEIVAHKSSVLVRSVACTPTAVGIDRPSVRSASPQRPLDSTAADGGLSPAASLPVASEAQPPRTAVGEVQRASVMVSHTSGVSPAIVGLDQPTPSPSLTIVEHSPPKERSGEQQVVQGKKIGVDVQHLPQELEFPNLPEGVRRTLGIISSRGWSAMDPFWADGWTSLHWAAEAGRVDVCRWLVDGGADPNAVDAQGRTPVNLAAAAGLTDVLRVLKKEGPPSLTDVDLASLPQGFVDILHAVDTHGWDTLQWSEGWTALHFAAQQGRSDVCSFLVARGADAGAKDKEGRTPVALAREGGHVEVERVLKAGC